MELVKAGEMDICFLEALISYPHGSNSVMSECLDYLPIRAKDENLSHHTAMTFVIKGDATRADKG